MNEVSIVRVADQSKSATSRPVQAAGCTTVFTGVVRTSLGPSYVTSEIVFPDPQDIGDLYPDGWGGTLSAGMWVVACQMEVSIPGGETPGFFDGAVTMDYEVPTVGTQGGRVTGGGAYTGSTSFRCGANGIVVMDDAWAPRLTIGSTDVINDVGILLRYFATRAPSICTYSVY